MTTTTIPYIWFRFSNNNTVTHSSSTPSTLRNASVSFYKNKRFSFKQKHNRNDYENLDNYNAMNNNSANDGDNDNETSTADANANAMRSHDECDNNEHENATCR